MTPLTSEAVAYRARALAQAHPLSKLAKQYLDWAVADQRTSQPIPEIGIWAGAALLEGYCVRRVEEEDLDLEVGGPGGDDGAKANGEPLTVDELDKAAAVIAAEIRTGYTEDGAEVSIYEDPAAEERLLKTLDNIVAKQVSHRLDHWRDSVDDEAYRELEEYMTWWVVKGYALRVAESNLGAVHR
jgi:hypothetical protein